VPFLGENHNHDSEKQEKQPKPSELVESLKKISDAIAEVKLMFLNNFL
jgi:hypothetical protein